MTSPIYQHAITVSNQLQVIKLREMKLVGKILHMTERKNAQNTFFK